MAAQTEYTNKFLTDGMDDIYDALYIRDASLSNDFYWGASNTLEVSVGALPGGVTRTEAITWDDAVDTSLTTYVDGSLVALSDTIDTSLVAYTDAAIITAMDASLPLYETKVNIDASFISMGYNITTFPANDAAGNNGDYISTVSALDTSFYFKSDDVWLLLEASLLFP